MERDGVDDIAGQWRRERPDVDMQPMEVIGRISRLERRLAPLLAEVFEAHGLEPWEFDVLASLRRSGAPYELTPGQLLDTMMITSGAVTHRISRLEGRGLVERRPDPDDGRVVRVRLTAEGFRLIEAAMPAHAANEAEILSVLSGRDRASLVRILRRLLASLEARDR